MKTNIKILINNIEKKVHQNIYTGELYIKSSGEQLKCLWVDNDTMEVAFYGYAPVLEQ